MVEKLNSKNIPYFLGIGAASVSGFAVAYLVSHNLSGEYNPGTVALATGVAKETTFFVTNLFAHTLLKDDQYKDQNECTNDLKNLTKSNLLGMTVSISIKASVHYELMKHGFNPESSMWLVYIPAGCIGGLTKFAVDFKNDLFGMSPYLKDKLSALKNKLSFKKKRKLEDLI